MKASSLLVLFCLLSVILCDTTGVTKEALKASFEGGLNFMKAFHKTTYTLGKGIFNKYTLTNPLLAEENIDFKVENGLVRVIFQNIKLTLSGSATIRKSQFFQTTSVGATLDSTKYELGYTFSSTKLADGKYEVKFSKASESEFTYKIARLTSKFSGLTDLEDQLKARIQKLDFTVYKDYLKKIANLVLETLPSYMK